MSITAEQQALQLLRSNLLHNAVSMRMDRVHHTSHNNVTNVFNTDVLVASYEGRYNWKDTHAQLCKELIAWNILWLAEVVPALQAKLEIPAGHEFVEPPKSCTEQYWANMSARVLHSTLVDDPQQITTEIRFFPAEGSAHIFMSFGSVSNGTFTHLLKGQAPFLRGKTPAELVELIVDRYHQGLAAAKGLREMAA